MPDALRRAVVHDRAARVDGGQVQVAFQAGRPEGGHHGVTRARRVRAGRRTGRTPTAPSPRWSSRALRPPARRPSPRRNPGIRRDRAGSATTSWRDLPSSARSPLYSAATSAARLPHWRMASERRISFFSIRRASSVRSSACGMDDGAGKALRNGKLHDVQRLVAPDQDEAAQEGRGHVVGVRRAARHPLGLHRERQQLAAVRAGCRPGGSPPSLRPPRWPRSFPAPSSAASAFPGRSPRRTGWPTLSRKRADGHRGGVLFRITGEPAVIARDATTRHPASARNATMRDRVAGRVQRKAQHVEPRGDIRHGGGREDGDAVGDGAHRARSGARRSSVEELRVDGAQRKGVVLLLDHEGDVALRGALRDDEDVDPRACPRELNRRPAIPGVPCMFSPITDTISRSTISSKRLDAVTVPARGQARG